MLPKNWKELELGGLVDRMTNGSSLKQVDVVNVGMLPITRIETIAFEEINLDRVKYVEASGDDYEKFGLKYGDILFSHINSDKHLGKTAINKSEKKIIHGINLLLIRTNNFCDSFYLNYYLRFYRNQGRFLDIAQRSVNQSSINQKKLKQIKVLVPPFPEQQRIVAKLDALFGHLDQLKVRLEKIPDLLKQFRQAVLTQAFTGKLTEEWSKKNTYTPVQKKVQEMSRPPKPSRYKSKTTSVIAGKFALSVNRPDLQIPERFLWIELVEVARLETGHTPSRKHPEYWEPGDVCWIGIKDASDNHSKTIVDTYQKTNNLGLANSAARLLPAGTVCLSRTASVGYVVKMGKPMATSQDFVNWVCTEAVDPDWLKWLMVAEEESIWNFGKGTTHKTVYFPEVIAFHIALPPIEEQKEIVGRIESLIEMTDRIEASYKTLQEKMDQLPQAILSKAFRGELVPQETEKELRKYNEQLGKMEMAAEP